jgi:hypothetical protein
VFGLIFPRASRRPAAVGFLLGFLLGLGGHVAAQEASPYGINAHTPEGPAGDLLLDQAQAAGIRWLRIDFSWQDLEPSRGIFNWQVMDALTAAAASRGLQLFASVGGTPAWATDGLPYSGVPRNVADWTDFCTRSVQRYKTSIRAWGFWNEPNLSGSWDGTRQQFIDIILKPGADAVHAADPGARVAGPELAHLVGGGALWYRWLADIIQQMGSQLDVVTHHAYSISGSAGVTAKLDATTTFGMNPAYWDYIAPSVREVLVSTGWFGRPFWLTESGWASNLVGEAAQASYLTGLLNDWFTEAPGRGWVGKIFFYELIDDGRPGIDLFGILRSDLTRKPAYDAYRSFIQAAPAGSCNEDSLTMCLIGGRYRVTSYWRNQYAGGALSNLNKTRLTNAIGAFWLSDSSSFEYLIRIDTATDNGRAWIAIPAFTDVEFWIMVQDTVSGQSQTYHSSAGNRTLIYDPFFFVYP